jgi:hypothetical protein
MLSPRSERIVSLHVRSAGDAPYLMPRAHHHHADVLASAQEMRHGTHHPMETTMRLQIAQNWFVTFLNRNAAIIRLW